MNLVFYPAYLPMDIFACFCWVIVAVGAGYAVFIKTCTNVLECTSLAWLSLTALARAVNIFRVQSVSTDTVFLAMAAALYVLVKYYEGTKKKHNQKDRSGCY